MPGTNVVVEFHSPDGEYATEYYDDESQPWEGDQLSITQEVSVSGIDAQLARAGRISGYVRDAAGQPVSHVGLNLCPQDSYYCNYASADESGFFEFGGVAAGSYKLTASMPWPQSSIERSVVVSEGGHLQVNLGGPPGEFSDVPEDVYYSVPVKTLAGQGVFEGTECDAGSVPAMRSTARRWRCGWCASWTARTRRRRLETRFNDVEAAGFHAPFIERMADLGVTTGCGDRTGFCPDRNVIRAEMAVFLSRAYNPARCPRSRVSWIVPSDAWYAAEVARLAASKITTGCGDRTGFCPGRDTTRAHMATFLYRAENRAS